MARTNMSLSISCPNCGGKKLSRKTIDPKRPFGSVECSDCPFKSSIQDLVKRVQKEKIEWAKARRRAAKG